MTAEGRWMRLESAIGGKEAKSRRLSTRARAARDKASAWVVLMPGTPTVGEQIVVRLVNGKVQRRYVQSIVLAAHQRPDGKSVLAVSKSPVMPPASTTAAPMSTPSPPPPLLLRQRNPRVCEECEGPCRPGAGMCDGCKGLRGERRAEDGVMLKAGPEPEDVF